MCVCVWGGGGCGRLGRYYYRGGSFAGKCISTTPIGALIYILPLAAIPPAVGKPDCTVIMDDNNTILSETQTCSCVRCNRNVVMLYRCN